jgi:hypothetical protein
MKRSPYAYQNEKPVHDIRREFETQGRIGKTALALI